MFKSDANPAVSNSDENDTLILAAAGSVSPVNELNAVNRAALCKSATVVHVQRNDQLKPEGANRWLMYLTEGSLTLYDGKDEVANIAAKSHESLQPLFQDKSAYQLAKTQTVAKIVKFGREQLDILLREQQKNAISVLDVQVSEKDNVVFDSIMAEMKTGKPSMASFGEAATKILMSHSQVAGIPELAEIIQSDPGLSMNIVNAANRADGGAGDSITSIRGAISRLGVETTQRSLEELLKQNTIVPATDVIERRFRRYMQRVALSTAIVQVLSRELPDLQPEVATLVALNSDIGELMIIEHANKNPDQFAEDADLDGVIDNLRTIVSGWLLSDWDFPEEFINSANVARDWYRNHTGDITYTDLVTASLLIIQSEMPDGQPSSIPSSDNLLLARRLQQAGIDLKAPAEIMRAATSKLVTVQSLLKAG